MARPFRFKLQKLLDLREQREAQAQQALAQAQLRHQKAVMALQELEQRRNEAEREQQDKPAQTAAELWLWRSYSEALEKDLQAAALRVEELAKELQNARQVVIDRARERKLLDKLKQNQEKRHVREDEHAEQKEFDEASALRHGYGDR